jgi:hypothetical protein
VLSVARNFRRAGTSRKTAGLNALRASRMNAALLLDLFRALKARNDAKLFRPVGAKRIFGGCDLRVARETRLPWAILFHAVGVQDSPTRLRRSTVR